MARRVVLGELADSTYGLRVSKSGFDADANPPVPGNLIFDSSWPQILPIHQSGQTTINANASLNIAFPQLGYVPLFSMAIKSGDGNDYWADSLGPTVNWGFDGNPQSEYNGYNGQNSSCQFLVAVTDSNLAISFAYNSGIWCQSIKVLYIIYRAGVSF